MILEAKIEVLKDKNEEIHQEIKSKKIEKNKLYTKRDELIDEKRRLQKIAYELNKNEIPNENEDKLSQLSDNIGNTIEKSKALSSEIQLLYEQTKINSKNIYDMINNLKEKQRDSNDKIYSYQRKVALIDNELTKLRNKMKEIREKLEDK